MNAINSAIKLNIQYHFERFCKESDAGCSDCPFSEECHELHEDRCRCLCEIITGKNMGELTKDKNE